jgi:hypothetical protein
MVSGKAPVEATELTVEWRALLNVGDARLLGISPVEPTNSLLTPLEVTAEVPRENVGDASSVSGNRPVDATYLELEDVGATSPVSGRRPVEATYLELEENVDETSSVSERRAVEATSIELVAEDGLALDTAVGDGSFEGTMPPVEATNAIDELVVTLALLVIALEGAVGCGSLAVTRPPVEAT